MFNFLLSHVTSSDGVPDGVASGLAFDTDSFIFGIFTGLFITFILWCIKKVVKIVISDYKEKSEESNKSDE